MLEKRFGIKEGGRGEPKWADALQEASQLNLDAYDKDMATDREIARKMIRIVDEETRLALQEGQKVVRGRKGKPIRPRWPT